MLLSVTLLHALCLAAFNKLFLKSSFSPLMKEDGGVWEKQSPQVTPGFE